LVFLRAHILISIFIPFVFQAPSYAQEASTIVILPQEIHYKATGSGAETAVLYGDPTKAGLYVMRLRLPAGAKVLPHIHPEEVRTLTVISGTLYFGFGEKWDESKLKAYPAGTFFPKCQQRRISLLLRMERLFFKRQELDQVASSLNMSRI